jgi:hypothetical protein
MIILITLMVLEMHQAALKKFSQVSVLAAPRVTLLSPLDVTVNDTFQINNLFNRIISQYYKAAIIITSSKTERKKKHIHTQSLTH